ncbi:MAG: isochorismatase family protein [Planctomycetes bacterium]|nr:isochorismatase family protein [Planctomycetota bacterium]
MQRPLVVIDVQRGNITEYNRFISAGIASIIKAELFNPIIFTRYVNTPDCPAKRFLNFEQMKDFGDAGMSPEISEVMGGKTPPLDKTETVDLGENFGAKRFLITKSVYSCFTPEFEELVADLSLDNTGIYFVGAGTESMILKSALDCFERGIEPIVLAQYCGSQRGLGYHEKALEILKQLIGEERVIKDFTPLRQRWERAKK